MARALTILSLASAAWSMAIYSNGLGERLHLREVAPLGGAGKLVLNPSGKGFRHLAGLLDGGEVAAVGHHTQYGSAYRRCDLL